VTNWFRNLRQTARKRAKKPGEDGDTDSQLNSTTVSRAVTPSFASSSSSGIHDQDMDTEVESENIDDAYGLARGPVHSDAGSDDDEYQEAVTPSPEPSPSPPLPSYGSVGYPSAPRTRRGLATGLGIDAVTYAELEKVPGRISGVKVEDALLLLGFHHHIVH